VIELLQQGQLSEGHGRALLLAEDHANRRLLARRAVEGAWSVRLTEQRAREINAGSESRPPRPELALHPDQEQAAAEISQALSGALGADVKVRAVGAGYRAELSFGSPQEAIELARRVRPRVVA
jgi:ParB family chromosome partitioning protein